MVGRIISKPGVTIQNCNESRWGGYGSTASLRQPDRSSEFLNSPRGGEKTHIFILETPTFQHPSLRVGWHFHLMASVP